MPTVEAMSRILPAKAMRNARTADGHYGRSQTEISILSAVFQDGMDTGIRISDKTLWDNVKARVTFLRDPLQLCNSTMVMEVSTPLEHKSLPSLLRPPHPHRLAILCTTDGRFKLMMRLDVPKAQVSAAMEVLAAHRDSIAEQ